MCIFHELWQKHLFRIDLRMWCADRRMNINMSQQISLGQANGERVGAAVAQSWNCAGWPEWSSELLLNSRRVWIPRKYSILFKILTEINNKNIHRRKTYFLHLHSPNFGYLFKLFGHSLHFSLVAYVLFKRNSADKMNAAGEGLLALPLNFLCQLWAHLQYEEQRELVDWKTRTAFRSIDELTLRLEDWEK